MAGLVVVLLVGGAGFARSQVAPELLARAEELLLTSEDPGEIRALASAIVARDPDRARETARLLARGDWKRALSALAIWTRLGAPELLREAVDERSFDRSPNLAIRMRTLEALVACDLEHRVERILERLDDPVWLVRRAALAVAGALDVAALEPSRARVLRRLDDPIPELGDRAREVALRAAAGSPAFLEALLERPWWQWRDRRAKRRLCWAALDAGARGFELRAELVRSDRGDAFSRLLDLAFAGPGPERNESFLRHARDPSARELVGDELAAALRELVAADEAWLAEESWGGGPMGEGVLREIVRSLVPGAGRRLRLLMLEDRIASLDRERVEEAVLREAFERPPARLAAMLDALFDEIGPQGASRRRLRRIMKLRSSLDVPIPDDLLLRGLVEGPFPRRVIVTEQIWRRSDAGLRAKLLAFLDRELDRLDRDREPVLRILVERPREEALAHYERVIADPALPEDLRIRAVDAVTGLDPRHRFARELIETTGGELGIRLIEHEIGVGGPGREFVARAIAGETVADLPLDLLRLASLCEIPELDRAIVECLEQGAFDSRRLSAYVDYLDRRFGRERAQAEVEALIGRTLDRDESERALSAFARMDGKVLEHLIDVYRPRLGVARLFALATSPQVDEADRVLYAVARLARERGEAETFEGLLGRRWRELHEGEMTAPGAALDALAHEILLAAADDIRGLVVAEAERAVLACCGKNLELESAFEAAVLLESVFQALVESGDRGALVEAFRLLRLAEDRLARVRLDGVPQGECYDPRLSMVSVLTAETRGREPIDDIAGLVEARDDDFVCDWARQSLRFPEIGIFGPILAERLLGMTPSLLRDEDHLLTALGARLMSGPEADVGARLLLRGSRLAGARSAPDASGDGFERILLSSGLDESARFFLTAEARLMVEKRLDLDLGRLGHRGADDRRLVAYLALARRIAGRDPSASLDDLRRDGDDFAGIDALRLRLALDARRFDEARDIARHALERIAVFGASERNGDIPFFTAFEAAALWGLGRRDEARLLLERVGIRDLAALRGPLPSDFP